MFSKKSPLLLNTYEVVQMKVTTCNEWNPWRN